MRLSALLFAMAVLVATATFDDQMRERAVYLESLEWPDESAALSSFFRSPLPLFTKLSREEAGRLTDRGQPFVVTDASFGRAEWSCEYLKTSFPKAGLARQPYSQDSLDVEGPTLKSLFDPGWNATFQLVVPVDDVRNPNVVSWFTPSLAGPEYASLAGALSVPYFLDDSASNRANIEGRIEFFLGAKGSGVHPHTDPQCQWVLSTQFSGRKNWRLAMPVNIRKLVELNKLYRFVASDSTILQMIQMKRRPLYELTLNPGEILAFPPGMIHSTRVVSEECSVSLSVAFMHNPMIYVDRWSENLVADMQVGRCYPESWNKILFGVHVVRFDDSDGSIEDRAAEIFSEMDANKDSIVDKTEAEAYFKSQEGVNPHDDLNVVEKDSSIVAASFLQFHSGATKERLNETYHRIWSEFFQQWSNHALIFPYVDTDLSNDISLTEFRALFPLSTQIEQDLPYLDWPLSEYSYHHHIGDLYDYVYNTHRINDDQGHDEL